MQLAIEIRIDEKSARAPESNVQACLPRNKFCKVSYVIILVAWRLYAYSFQR